MKLDFSWPILPERIRIGGFIVVATLALAASANTLVSRSVAQSPDVTAHIERLGNPGKISFPTANKAFARNAWALQAFAGRLYVGIGDNVANEGPVDIWYFDPASGQFIKEWSAPDEMVDTFRVVDGKLIVPGNDPMEPWDLGNFYRLESDGWKKIRTLPNGLHNFDMIKFGGVLYAALGTESGAVVAASADDGQTWVSHRLLPVINKYYARAWGFLVVAGKLYVSATGHAGGQVFVLEGGAFSPAPEADFFLAKGRAHHFLLRGFTPFRGQAVYIAREFVWRGPSRVELFAASDLQKVRRLEHLQGAVPRAVAATGERLYVLWTRQNGDAYDNHVFETHDLAEWREAFRFRTSIFVRSMEVLGGDFYFGLGSNRNDVKPDNGEILRLRSNHAAAR